MILTLHIGLPKTATTTMQETLFPTLSGISYRGKGGGVEVDQSLKKLLFGAWTLFTDGDSYHQALRDFVEKAMDDGSNHILISDEALSAWKSPQHPRAAQWPVSKRTKVDVPRNGKHPINEFLLHLSEKLHEGVRLQVILSLRNQADYLGSLAAEYGNRNPRFVEDALIRKDRSLEFFGIVRDLQETLGDKNLLVLLFEDGLEVNSRRIQEFLGVQSSKTNFQTNSRLNVRRAGEGVWRGERIPSFIISTIRALNATKLGRLLIGSVKAFTPNAERMLPKVRVSVKITEEQRDTIRSHFKIDNQKLSKLLGRSLQELGY